jgi:hypothetical protein
VHAEVSGGVVNSCLNNTEFLPLGSFGKITVQRRQSGFIGTLTQTKDGTNGCAKMGRRHFVLVSHNQRTVSA